MREGIARRLLVDFIPEAFHVDICHVNFGLQICADLLKGSIHRNFEAKQEIAIASKVRYISSIEWTCTCLIKTV